LWPLMRIRRTAAFTALLAVRTSSPAVTGQCPDNAISGVAVAATKITTEGNPLEPQWCATGEARWVEEEGEDKELLLSHGSAAAAQRSLREAVAEDGEVEVEGACAGFAARGEAGCVASMVESEGTYNATAEGTIGTPEHLPELITEGGVAAAQGAGSALRWHPSSLAGVAKQQLGQSWRRSSVRPECQATPGPRDDPTFMERVRPCGELSAICTDIPLVEANVDYPGGGVGAVVPDQDYVVQFDIGLHPEVAKLVLRGRLREIDSCLHCPSYEEICLEAVVRGGAMWGDLGMANVNPRDYDCMGGCGRGCSASRTRDDVGALDCMKHDLCSAWKTVRSGRKTRGFCHDPDCGDEAAMTLFNCWKGWRLFGALGGSRRGPFSVPAICESQEKGLRGCWSHGGWFTQGRCKIFQGWKQGQGIPDPHPLRSPIQRL